ncbi:SAM-dependent methyltransferase [Lactobacillus sp. PV034]|uniref:SAM-dependent methyltransferase n=1 Tax=Lactobacillus sp. PV034 TaxID=2594495 RepID=UPI00223EC618|nr:SAM-dependent methyltransferase [Lactobacillus sp. PV034]QNQ80398.1 SAM-dependent methyltransferase [Lactobacillus sp. PV034]
MNNYQKKLHHIQQIVSLPEIDLQITEIDHIIESLNKKRVLKQAPAKLGFYPDQLEELLAKRPVYKEELITLTNLLDNFRSFLSRHFGLWSLANQTTIEAIKETYHCKTGLELMAGNAYWSKGFNEAGVKMQATDSFSWAKSSATGRQTFFPTKMYEASQAIREFTDVDLIICCWAPNFGDGDKKILETWRQYGNPKTTLLFIGEKNGATNTPAFWKEAIEIHSPQLRKINRSFSSFDFIEEKIFEIK